MLDVASTLHGARVLLVEDDFILLTELESILTDAGAVIAASCQTVHDALRRAAEDDISIAILDIRLGRQTSASVARRLAQRGIPFLFYTGQVENDPLHAEWPDCKIVPKPAPARAIVAALAALLQQSRVRQPTAGHCDRPVRRPITIWAAGNKEPRGGDVD